MKRLFLLSILLLGFVTACHRAPARNRINENKYPRVILWAWERPEDLSFIDANKFGVAFLAQTLTIRKGDVAYNPRRQPLKLPPNVKLIAVTRIESQKITHEPTTLTDDIRKKLVERIRKTLELENVSAIQVDFDVVSSERKFYQQLLEDLRQQLPEQVPLSMTALASFCVGDNWLADLPVDEVVPMVFRMGTDSDRIKNFLTSGQDFREGLCRQSYGVALDEPIKPSFERQRRVYVFNAQPWTTADVSSLAERFGI